MEFALLQELKRAAINRGITVLLGRYVLTSRNAMVADHYLKLGFVETSVAQDGSRTFEIAVAEIEEPGVPMTIDRGEITDATPVGK